jgi:pimeloyl-[acyl-carrier protein] methyl ester esterase
MNIKIIGEGYPIVMLHGWAMNLKIFEPFVELFNIKKYKFILINLPDMHDEMIWDEVIEEIDGSLKKISIKEFDLFGWSLGGHIAIDIYLKNKTLVNQLYLVATTPQFVNSEQWKLGLEKNIFENFSTGILSDSKKTLNKFFNLQLIGQENKKDLLNFLDSNVSKEKINISSLHNYLKHMETKNYNNALEQISCQVNLISGKKDKIVPIESQYELLKLIKNKRHLFIDEASHIPFLSHAVHCKSFMMRNYE